MALHQRHKDWIEAREISADLAEKFGLEPRQVRSLVQAWVRSKNTKPAAIQFLFLLANAIARLCFQEYQLRQRINEITAVYSITMMLSESRNLKKVLRDDGPVSVERADGSRYTLAAQRSGGRSRLPVMASCAPVAAVTRSPSAQSAFGPCSPNPLTTTCTRRGLIVFRLS